MVGVCSWSVQSCATLCEPTDCSPLDSSVHGIFQARILEWVAKPFSRGSSPPSDWTCISCTAAKFFPLSHLGSPTYKFQFSSVQSLSRVQLHGLQHARPPCPSPTPGACSNSHLSSWWCHPTISSSVVPCSFHLQSFLASGSFPMSQFLVSGGQSIGVSSSASVLPMNIQSWFPLGWTGWICLQSQGLSRVFSNNTV